jgi:hypothetical protein
MPPTLLVLALLSLPASGFMSSGVLNYFANFNDPQGQGGGTPSWKAIGGSATVEGAPGIFDVVFPTPQDGVIEIQANPGTVDADLVCELALPVEAQSCDIGFALSAIGDISDLDVRFEDVGDTGILDLQFTEDRRVLVGGQDVALPLLPGEVDLYVNITLQTSIVGSQMWDMTLTGPTSSLNLSGTLNVPTLSLASIHFLRRAGQVGDIWHLDNVVVTSNDPDYTDLVPIGANRSKQ